MVGRFLLESLIEIRQVLWPGVEWVHESDRQRGISNLEYVRVFPNGELQSVIAPIRELVVNLVGLRLFRHIEPRPQTYTSS